MSDEFETSLVRQTSRHATDTYSVDIPESTTDQCKLSSSRPNYTRTSRPPDSTTYNVPSSMSSTTSSSASNLPTDVITASYLHRQTASSADTTTTSTKPSSTSTPHVKSSANSYTVQTTDSSPTHIPGERTSDDRLPPEQFTPYASARRRSPTTGGPSAAIQMPRATSAF